jgi:hypothetical protein
MNNGNALWAVIVGAVLVFVALISLVPASWVVPTFFGVVGIALIIWWAVKNNKLLSIARWYAWVFGTVLLTIVGAILLLPYLNAKSQWQWALVLGLFLFIIATLATNCHDARKLR